MFQIRDLTVKKGNKKILDNINLSIKKGEGVVVFGPNGGGKSTLFKALMGLDEFSIEGDISLENRDVASLDIDERVNMGLTYMYQTPPFVKGVELSTLIAQESNFEGDINELYSEMKEDLKKLDTEKLFEREINVGLSGGEIKRSELLTLSVLRDRKVFLLDEPDSGVDIENVKRLGEYINDMVEGKSYMIVTHSGEILKYLKPSRGIVIVDGQLVYEGSVEDILSEVKKNGYSKFSSKEL